MVYSEEQLKKIEGFAAKFTPISDIAILMGLDTDVLKLEIKDSSSLVSEFYRRGKATTAMKLREQEIELALVGSPLAVQLTTSYLTDMDIDEDL